MSSEDIYFLENPIAFLNYSKAVFIMSQILDPI